MSVLDKFEVVDSHEKFPAMVPAIAFKLSSEPVRDSAVAFARKYTLVCTVGTSFTANESMYNDARRDAEQMVRIGLFRDMIPLAYKCKDAIRAGDANGANSLLNTMIDLMNGGGK